MSAFGPAAMTGLLTTAGIVAMGRQLERNTLKRVLGGAIWLDAFILFFCLWKFGHSEFGATAATIACVTTALACYLTERRLGKITLQQSLKDIAQSLMFWK